MHLFKIGFALGAAMLAGAIAALAQQVVKVGYSPTNPPLSILPGATPDNYKTLDPKTTPQGAMIELMNAIAKDAGLELQFVPLLDAEVIPGLTSKAIDITAGTAMSPEFQTAVDFSAPLFNSADAMIVKKGDPKPYRDWEDLKGEVVGCVAGGSLADALQKSGLFKEVRFLTSGVVGAQAVSDGQLKAWFATSVLAAAGNIQQGTPQYAGVQIVQSYKPHFPVPRGIAVRKDQGDLLKKIDASVAKLKANGTMQAIFTKVGLEGVLVK